MYQEFEEKTLEEAYEKASSSLSCSVNDLDIDIVQVPSNGLFGFFKKNAIISVKLKKEQKEKKEQLNINTNEKVKSKDVKNFSKSSATLTSKLNELNELNSEVDNKPKIKIVEKVDKKVIKEKIFNDFYDSKEEKFHSTPIVKKEVIANTDKNNSVIITEIKDKVNKLFSSLCYNIDEIKVDIIEDNKIVYIEFNGEDSALLIGKEGYRYKALSYILFNWINEKYSMMLRLEIAEFLENQEIAMFEYLVPVIETIKKDGFFKTKVLDGILVHIALTKLRDEFPDKYVAVKTTQKGEKYILINEYRK